MIRLLMLAAAYAMSVVRAIDLYFFRTVLLIHGNGANGSTAIRDSSFSNKQITVYGNAQISTAQSKFGGSSLYFDGTGDYISTPSSTDFDLGTIYTIEFWIRPTTLTGGVVHRAFYTTSNQTWIGLAFSLRFVGVTSLRCYFYATTSSDEQFLDVVGISVNVWTHVAVVRNGTTGMVYVNGVPAGTITALNTPAASTQTLRIGEWDFSAGVEYLNGYVNDLLISKGVARYTANFTPPALQLPDLWADPYFDKVVLSLHGQSMVDSSPLPKTITANGNVAVSTAQSKFGGSSLYFDGTGDYLTLGGGATVTLSGDFTFECWVYPLALQSSCIADTRTTGAQLSLTFNLNLNGSVGSYLHPTMYDSPVGAYSANVWTHLAFSRQGSVARVFSNGSLIYTFTYTPPGSGGNLFRIGANIDAGYFVNGYIDDLRLTNGVARYTASFIPPAQQSFDEWADMYLDSVVLLLHGDGPNASTVIVDSSPVPKTVTPSGNVQISTAQKMYGGASMYFDGNGDYLTIPSDTAFDLGSTFTIEFWLRMSSLTSSSGIMLRGSYSTGSATWTDLAFSVRWLGTYMRFYFYGTSSATEQVIDVTGGISINTWIHIAMVRTGTTGTIYYNGVSVGTISGLNTPAASAQTLRIGEWNYNAGVEYLTGYIDDLRITKGVARYTANFTPPILAFPHGS